jgi:hypothetical protein
MQSAKKSTKIVSALAMAAAATLAAKTTKAATLSLYYGQAGSAGTNTNNVETATAVNLTTKSVSSVTGNKLYMTNPTAVTVSQTAPTTITIPVGTYLSLALDAVLTGNIDPNAGAAHPTIPTYLGLSELSTGVNSTDANGSILPPVALNSTVLGTFNGQPTFKGTANFNQKIGANNANSVAGIPTWTAASNPADVQPAQTGNVGLNGYNTGGNTSTNATATAAAGYSKVRAFAGSTGGYANSTDFVDDQIFKGLSAGKVTLTPFAAGAGSQYWTDVNPSGTGTGMYKPKTSEPATLSITPRLWWSL